MFCPSYQLARTQSGSWGLPRTWNQNSVASYCCSISLSLSSASPSSPSPLHTLTRRHVLLEHVSRSPQQTPDLTYLQSTRTEEVNQPSRRCAPKGFQCSQSTQCSSRLPPASAARIRGTRAAKEMPNRLHRCTVYTPYRSKAPRIPGSWRQNSPEDLESPMVMIRNDDEHGEGRWWFCGHIP